MKFKLRKKLGTIHIGIILFIIVFISLFLILKYYFYADDYSMLYHLQNNITPQWPYEFVPLIYKPIYKLFGLAPEAYAFFGFITYFALTISVYLLSHIIFKKKSIALFTSAIFATGYVGIDQFTQLSVSSVNNISNLAICVILIIYLFFMQTQKKKVYVLSLFLFVLIMNFFSFRGFTLLLFIPALEVITLLGIKNIRLAFVKIPFILLRLIPFTVIAYKFGIFSYGKKVDEDAIVSSNVISIFTTPFSPDFLAELVRIVGRIVAPETFIGKIFKIVMTQEGYFLIGLLFLLITFLTAVSLYKKNQMEYFRGILIFMTIMLGGFAGNLILLLSFDSNGPINRYLNISFIGYSGMLSILFFLLSTRLSKMFSKKPMFLYSTLMVVIITILATLSIKFEKEIARERSDPSRSFFKQILAYVPKVSQKTLFYFDYADSHPTYARFGNIMVGAYLPREAALAVHYKTKLQNVKIMNTFDELKNEIGKNPGQKYYTFYYDQKGLLETTKEVSDLLARGGSQTLLQEEKGNSSLFTPEVEIGSAASSVVPFRLNFSLGIDPLDYSLFNFPHTELKPEDPILRKYQSKTLDKKSIFSYLLSRKNYYETVSLSVSGSHVNGLYLGELAADDKSDTYWIADENAYSMGVIPWIEIDLKEEKNIGKLLWINETAGREPKKINVLVSIDNKQWRKVKILFRKKFQEEKSIVVLSIEPQVARFIRLEIKDTVGKITPGLSELEIIENIHSSVDLELARRIKENPFEYIRDKSDLTSTYGYLRDDSVLTIKTLTNKDAVVSDVYNLRIPVIFDGQFHEYTVTISPRGLKLQKVIFRLPYPAKMQVKNVLLKYYTLKK